MNEKSAVALADGFAKNPVHLKEPVERALAQLEELMDECRPWVVEFE